MADKYNSMKELYSFEPLHNYRLTHRLNSNSPVLILAPHGGGIEFITSEIAHEVAANHFSLFDFAGVMPERNFSNLHVTSRHYDCSIAKRLSSKAHFSLAIHGCKGEESEKATFIGGQDRLGRQTVQRHLEQAGFIVKEAPAHLSGLGADNIVNQNQRCMGIQLELTTAQRQAFISMPILSFITRKKHSSLFYRYCDALRNAMIELSECQS